MANKGNGPRLAATNSGPKPGDFPLGSLESRAAARSTIDGMGGRDCICFPPNEPPHLQLKAEIEAAKAVRCPLHGARFSQLAPAVYTAARYTRPAHLEPESRLAWHSKQYVKALKASFPPDRWPATEVAEPDGSTRLVLKDGTEIHRIGPPPEFYDYDTGKLIGRLGPRRSEFNARC
jgi:hypothetical protein